MERYLNKRLQGLNSRYTLLENLNNRFKGFRVMFFVLLLSLIVLFSFIEVALLLKVLIYSALAAIFILLHTMHRRLIHKITNLRHYLHFTATDQARLKLDWSTIPVTGQSIEPDHLFARDLDIVGKYSLHRLLDICVSEEGSARLLSWLTQSHPRLPDTIKRQHLIRELIPLSSWRRKLSLLIDQRHSRRLESEHLRSWLHRQSPRSLSRASVILYSVWGAINLLLLILQLLGLLPPLWVISLMGYFVSFVLLHPRIQPHIQDSSEIDSSVRDLRKVLVFIERYPFRPLSALSILTRVFHEGNSPVRELRLMDRTLNMIGWRNNLLMGLLLNAFMPWDMYCARLAIKSRELFRHSLPLWLDRLAELDALNSLAHYAWLHPDTVFPALIEQRTTPLLQVKKLGHPLIPGSERVSNDITLTAAGEILLITGSNMSGKSSFLKTIGINLCLAFAGGAVHAQSMTTGLFRLATCININDSITAGYSFFYTEVRRLKAILDELKRDKTVPVLFLIDEIFKGTNNRERLIGSRSLIHKLAGSNGLGLITTHDLELVSLEHEIPSISNHHFRENIIDNKMSFDYLLHPGPCPTTNALRIMKIEGLPVEE